MSAPVRWLSAEEQCAWRAYLRATKAVAEALDAQLQRDAGIPQTYYEVLVRLSEAPDRRLRMVQLADLTASSPSRLSHAVARLEERGWVERVSCPTDKRGQLAVLTDAGFAALVAAAPGHVERVRSVLFEPLSKAQVGQLHRICNQIADALDAEEPTAEQRSAAEPRTAAEPRSVTDQRSAAAGPPVPAVRPARR